MSCNSTSSSMSRNVLVPWVVLLFLLSKLFWTPLDSGHLKDLSASWACDTHNRYLSDPQPCTCCHISSCTPEYTSALAPITWDIKPALSHIQIHLPLELALTPCYAVIRTTFKELSHIESQVATGPAARLLTSLENTRLWLGTEGLKSLCSWLMGVGERTQTQKELLQQMEWGVNECGRESGGEADGESRGEGECHKKEKK